MKFGGKDLNLHENFNMFLHTKLEKRKEPIKIAFIGCGKFVSMFLAQYNQFLPSAQTRWCTKDLKIKPFERWVKSEFTEQGYTVYSYVAIRADEDFRQGLNSKNGSLIILTQ